MAVSPTTTNQKQHKMRTEYYNGGNIQAQIESLMAASGFCNELQNQLNGDAVVHPRDYLGGSESKDYAADVVEWRRMLDSIREVEAYCHRRAMELDALRSTARQSLALAQMAESYRGLNARGHRAGGAS